MKIPILGILTQYFQGDSVARPHYLGENTKAKKERTRIYSCPLR